MTLSTIIIAKNAESLIADAVSSVSFASEVIVIDNQSSDRTEEIARYCKAKVFSYESQDFSAMRSFGLHKVTGDWILYIDADERVTDSLAQSIELTIKDNGSGFSAFRIKRKNFYFGNHEWPYIEKMERLFKKDNLKGWKGEIHETPIITGKIGELDGFLLHYTHRDLSSMIQKTLEWSKIEAELRLKAGHPKMTLWRFPRVMISAFIDSYILQEGRRVGVVGLIESLYQAFSIFITYARLWELQQKKLNE